MSRSTSLQPSPDATREQVALLDAQVRTREAELAVRKAELRELQARYLEEIGPLYAELLPIDAAVVEAEIAAGLRVPEDPEQRKPGAQASPLEAAGCGRASAPSEALKRVFRDVARAVHPDRSPHFAADERTRYRRHSLMAEANRAYAERDEDRLRLILRAWELDPDLVIGEQDADTECVRLQRRASSLNARLVELDAECADLNRSAIARLKTKIDDARAQGWDLFGEMKRQVLREIAMGRATLARLQRRARRSEP